jgi:hypothetical protein
VSKAEIIPLENRKTRYTKLNRLQYYMVTFDLSGSDGRQATYARFRTRLGALIGIDNVVRGIKQVYFIRSDYLPKDIRSEMERVLEAQDSIIVTRLQPGESFRLCAPGAGRKARAFFADLERDEGEVL